ncbi:MAG: protein-export chaperone SecB [Leptospira sp.]|nr:protein-export chaperone SecB [Leptospira sp.]
MKESTLDENKQPEIIIESIFLATSNFHRNPFIPKDTKLDVKLNKQDDISPDKSTLVTNLIMEINTPEDPIYFYCNYVGVFRSTGKEGSMNLEKFRESNAPSHLYPYLREEFQSRVTKASLNHIIPILPPVNLKLTLAKGEEKK